MIRPNSHHHNTGKAVPDSDYRVIVASRPPPNPLVVATRGAWHLQTMASHRRRFPFFLAAALLLLLPASAAATDVEYCNKSITKGKLVIDVKYFFFHVHSESHDLCDEASCPATGEFVLAHEQTLPSITPPGSYTITMKLLDGANKELTCISFGFSIGFISPLAVI
ncbi:hypothetical protein E2562_012992 [Oryza meyeriana var. granulata]|nr:hypothetical protein E2562_012992 [Oryza meyeriana var. granulata]